MRWKDALDQGRKYSLDLIMARLPIGAEKSISIAFVVMCAEKILRLLRLFFVSILVLPSASQWPGCLWMELRNIWQRGLTESLLLG